MTVGGEEGHGEAGGRARRGRPSLRRRAPFPGGAGRREHRGHFGTLERGGGSECARREGLWGGGRKC